MAVNSVLSAGVQGVQAGLSRATAAAGDIARAGSTGENVDLATSLVDLKIGEQQVKASATVIRSADEMLGTLIDVRA